MFDWAEFRTAKGGIKLHTSWDYNLMIPDIVNITEAKVHDRYGLEQLSLSLKTLLLLKIEPILILDLMLNRIKAENVFVTRIKT